MYFIHPTARCFCRRPFGPFHLDRRYTVHKAHTQKMVNSKLRCNSIKYDIFAFISLIFMFLVKLAPGSKAPSLNSFRLLTLFFSDLEYCCSVFFDTELHLFVFTHVVCHTGDRQTLSCSVPAYYIYTIIAQ